jgi:hypothetical protein
MYLDQALSTHSSQATQCLLHRHLKLKSFNPFPGTKKQKTKKQKNIEKETDRQNTEVILKTYKLFIYKVIYYFINLFFKNMLTTDTHKPRL